MFYVFHGDDEHTQKKMLADLGRKLGDPGLLDLNTNQFDGRGLSFSALRHACDSMPFLTNRRLVIVKDLAQHKPPFMEDLIAYLPNLPEPTRLVFLESKKLPKSHPLLKVAEREPTGYVKLFERPEGGRLEKWIRKRATGIGGKMTPRAAHMLAVNVGNNLDTLENEIEKLVMFKGDGEIQAEDVSLLSPYVAEASIFDLVDAIGSRHGRSSARLLNHKLAEGADPFYLFAMIVRQFRLLIQVNELAEKGMKPPDIGRVLGIHSFVAGKVAQQSHNFSAEQLRKIYAHLLEMDVGVKTGETDMETALNLLVAGLTL